MLKKTRGFEILFIFLVKIANFYENQNILIVVAICYEKIIKKKMLIINHSFKIMNLILK